MVSTTNLDAVRTDPIDDRALRWLSILGLSLAALTTLLALALAMSANLGCR